MNTYDFKNDLTGSVFRLMGRILLIAIVSQIIVTLINYVITLAILPGFTEFTQQLQSQINPTGDPQEVLQQVIRNFTENGYSIGMILLFVLISFIITLIVYNLIFNAVRNEVSGGDNSLGSALNNAFDGRLVKYIGFSLLLGVLYIISAMLLVFIPIVGMLLIILVVFPIIIWFSSLGLAAIGINNHSIGEAFSLAKNNMTAARIAKVLGIGFLVFIVLVILGVIIGLLSSLVVSIPGVGVILSQIINAVLGAIITAFMLAGAAGLYYRYSDSRNKEEQFIVTD